MTTSSFGPGCELIGVAGRHAVANLDEQAIHRAVFPVGEERGTLEGRRALGASQLRSVAPRAPALSRRGLPRSAWAAVKTPSHTPLRVTRSSSSAGRSALSSLVSGREAVLLEQVGKDFNLDVLADRARRIPGHRVPDFHEQAGERVVAPVREKGAARQRRPAVRAAGELGAVAASAHAVVARFPSGCLLCAEHAAPDAAARRCALRRRRALSLERCRDRAAR